MPQPLRTLVLLCMGSLRESERAFTIVQKLISSLSLFFRCFKETFLREQLKCVKYFFFFGRFLQFRVCKAIISMENTFANDRFSYHFRMFLSQIAVWRRFKDFKKLHQELLSIYSQTNHEANFPSFPKAKFFGMYR